MIISHYLSRIKHNCQDLWLTVFNPIFVFFFGCLVELTQAWQTPFLDLLRSHLLGKLLLGTAFDWREFPTYALGSAIGWLWLLLIIKVSKVRFS
ncbi:MAG: DUF2809 domain-containing protein [Nostocaceae cyanobacterium]|nr:DUF2809 domain-containing protein [Nostocaceae cyanobacterium]